MLTQDQIDVLAHMVIDPAQWYADAISNLGPENAAVALQQKIDRWRPEYEAQKVSPEYKNRAERDAADRVTRSRP